MSKLITLPLALAALAVTATPALAHHNANAEWQTDKQLSAVGRLIEVRDINPHAMWTFDINGVKWKMEAISANALRRQGVAVKDVIRPGQVYTIYFAPSRTAGKTAGFLSAIQINGKKVTFVRL
jgi:hypothetical protein